jgi:hypothetical protein
MTVRQAVVAGGSVGLAVPALVLAASLEIWGLGDHARQCRPPEGALAFIGHHDGWVVLHRFGSPYDRLVSRNQLLPLRSDSPFAESGNSSRSAT